MGAENAAQQPERPKKSSNDHTNITPSVLNGLVHQEVNRHLEEEKIAPYDFDEVNIDELIEQSDLTLWKAICTMTRSVRDAKSEVEVTEAQTQVKKVRCYFILCCLMFCTDH